MEGLCIGPQMSAAACNNLARLLSAQFYCNYRQETPSQRFDGDPCFSTDRYAILIVVWGGGTLSNLLSNLFWWNNTIMLYKPISLLSVMVWTAPTGYFSFLHWHLQTVLIALVFLPTATLYQLVSYYDDPVGKAHMQYSLYLLTPSERQSHLLVTSSLFPSGYWALSMRMFLY